MRRAISFFLCDFVYFCFVLFFVLIANRRGCKGLDLECSRAAWGCILHSSCLKGLGVFVSSMMVDSLKASKYCLWAVTDFANFYFYRIFICNFHIPTFTSNKLQLTQMYRSNGICFQVYNVFHRVSFIVSYRLP